MQCFKEFNSTAEVITGFVWECFSFFMCKTDDVLSVCKDNLAELFLSVLLNYPIIILSEKEIVDSEIKKKTNNNWFLDRTKELE